jgi:hypothetical protein
MGGRKIKFTVTFTTRTRGEDGLVGDEAVMRLKGFLKVALRRFGMRCVELREEAVVVARAEAGKGERFVCPGWRSRSGQGRFW